MKIRIADSMVFIDIETIGSISEQEKETINDIINERDLKCAGCGKSLIDNGWIATFHRPKSAYNNKTDELKDVWTLYPLCYESRKECGKKWLDRRPQ